MRTTMAASVAGVAIGLGVAWTEPSVTAGLLIAITLALAAPLAVRARQHRLDVFEPIVIFAVAYGVMFVVRPLAMLAEDTLIYVRPSRAIGLAGTFDAMLTLALVGAVAFACGYGLNWGRRAAARLPAPPRSFDAKVVAGAAVAVAGVSALGFLGFLAGGGGRATLSLLLSGRGDQLTEVVGSSNKYLLFGKYLFIPAVVTIFALARLQKSRRLLLTGSALTCVFLLVTLPVGSRITLLPFLGSLLVFHFLRGQRRPSWRALIVITMLAVIGSSVLGTVRKASIREREGVATAALTTVKDPAKLLAPFTRGGDTEMAAAFASALTIVPEQVGYSYGRAVPGDFLLRPIPRTMWEGKPATPREKLIGQLVPAERVGVTANPEFSILMWFYLDFGALGVVAGMVALGALARTAFEYFKRFPDYMAVQLAYSLVLPFMVIAVRDSPVDTTARLAFVLLPLMFVFWLGARSGPRSMRASPAGDQRPTSRPSTPASLRGDSSVLGGRSAVGL